MIQYYETLARSSESIRRGKVADETAFLIMHETSMNAFFYLFKKNQYIAWSFLRAIITPHSLNNFDRIVIFSQMKKLE
jgi:hypothetical protein